MTVAQLIAALQQLPQSANVIAHVDDWDIVVEDAQREGNDVILLYSER